MIKNKINITHNQRFLPLKYLYGASFLTKVIMYQQISGIFYPYIVSKYIFISINCIKITIYMYNNCSYSHLTMCLCCINIFLYSLYILEHFYRTIL